MKKNYSDYGDVLNRIKQSVTYAFDRITASFGKSLDPDIRLYQSLHPQDIEELANIYGQDSVMEYVRKMEGKKLFGGNTYGKTRPKS